MRYAAPNYVIAAPVVAKTSTLKIVVIVAVIASIVIVVSLGVIGIALGLGLGLGLRNSNNDVSSLSAPTVSCNYSTATTACGCPSISATFSATFSARITDGTVATANSWPWIVALFTSSGSFFCGGVLITTQHVLTAAHCIDGQDPNKIQVHAGIQKLSTNASSLVRTLISATKHPDYSSLTYLNDIAILYLSTPYNKSSTVDVCCRTSILSLPAVNDHAVIAGWGQTSSTSGVSDDLQQAVTQVVSPSRCTNAPITNSDAQVCAGFHTTDACFGDSGSPLMTSVNNLWTCTGIVSFGSVQCNTYGVYTRVSNYNDFITQQIANSG